MTIPTNHLCFGVRPPQPPDDIGWVQKTITKHVFFLFPKLEYGTNKFLWLRMGFEERTIERELLGWEITKRRWFSDKGYVIYQLRK